LEFYTTCILNFITWNKAYSLFPDSTFLLRQTYLLKSYDPYYKKLLEKYERRGWTAGTIKDTHRITEKRRVLRNDNDNYQAGPSSKPWYGRQFWERRVADSNTWKLDLDTTKVQKAVTPDSVLEYSTFTIVATYTAFHPQKGVSGRYYEINACGGFKSQVLRHKYTWVDYHYDWEDAKPANSDFWLQFVGPKLDLLFVEEREKIPAEDRPAWRKSALSLLFRHSFE